MIDHEGNLYKCVGLTVGATQFVFGTAHDWDPANPLATADNPDAITMYLNTAHPVPDDECRACVWLPACGGGCPQTRFAGKRTCLPYRDNPEGFVLAMYASSRADQ